MTDLEKKNKEQNELLVHSAPVDKRKNYDYVLINRAVNSYTSPPFFLQR